MSSDLVVRVALIGGALLVALAVTIILRRRAASGPRSIENTGLSRGIYFFSSTACPDCRPVRKELIGLVGEAGFEELSWEAVPGVFHELGITAVPATLVVDNDGRGVLRSGRTAPALSATVLE